MAAVATPAPAWSGARADTPTPRLRIIRRAGRFSFPVRFPSGYITLDRRWLYLAGVCCLWALAFWQLTGPVAAFLAEAGRVRMGLPHHIRWVSGLPWWAVAVVGSLAALAVGPRLRPAGNAVLVGLPLAANVVIHLSLHAAQAAAVRGLMLYN